MIPQRSVVLRTALLAAAAGPGCSHHVAVPPLPARELPPTGEALPVSLGLFVDAAGVPERVVVRDSHDSPVCGFMRYPLEARKAFAESVVETVRGAADQVHLLDARAHPWSLRDRSLDAALAVRVEAFEVRLSPTRTLTGVDYQAASRIALSVLASTRQHGEVHRELRADAAGHAADRWGFRGCGRGALAASQAAARAIRNTMVQLARWIGSAPELRLPPAPEMQRGTGEPRLSDPKGRSR